MLDAPGPREGNSLAEIIGMPTGRPLRVGQLKRAVAKLEEAVVAVPFIEARDGRRKFYKLPRAMAQDAPPLVAKLRDQLEKYVFPPRFDFMTNPEMDPIAMYVFEFSMDLTMKDRADIWQNLPPDMASSFEMKDVTLEHELLHDHLLNRSSRSIRESLRWMVFKVKKRAAMDYTRFVKRDLVDNLDVIPSNIEDSPYSYNWPYDYFSLIELAKIDEAIEYGEKAESTRRDSRSRRAHPTASAEPPAIPPTRAPQESAPDENQRSSSRLLKKTVKSRKRR
jgi:hypothetical protein